MSSSEWNEKYKTGEQLSVWPWSDLVSYVMRYATPAGSNWRVLELGCGAGANIPFFRSHKAEYHAVDGSQHIVQRLCESFPEYRHQIKVSDFTESIPFEGPFDLVVDRAAVTHNSRKAIQHALALVHDKLKPGGTFIGIDWFSTEHSDFRYGSTYEDEYTKTNAEQGQFAGIGAVHFSDKAELQYLFRGFRLEILEHKTIRQQLPDSDFVFASWNLVARKG
ncbi:MAG: class I SAM-dependent methyltransferase [Bacteroidota bacterium]